MHGLITQKEPIYITKKDYPHRRSEQMNNYMN
jgi:hypothetical protein